MSQSASIIENVSCASADELSQLVKNAAREGRAILTGKNSKLPTAPLKQIRYRVDLTGADKVIEHHRADQVISVEAGITISALNDLLKKYQQWFPVYVSDPAISLMEYINSGSSGPLEVGFGESRDLVLGMQAVLGSGELIKCGGKVVKNVTGYDLPKLFAGAQGCYCIPSAHLRLYALPEYSSTSCLTFASIEQAFAAVRQVNRAGLPVSCMEIVDIAALRMLPTSKDKLKVELNTKAFLAVQVHGTEELVIELERELIEILQRTELPKMAESLKGDSENTFWLEVTRLKQLEKTKWIEIAGTNRSLEKIVEILKNEFSSLTYTARPSKNKALLILEEDANLDSIVSELMLACESLSCRITTAMADENYIYRTAQLPIEDAVLNELKHRLKREYDPNGILNPLSKI